MTTWTLLLGMLLAGGPVEFEAQGLDGTTATGPVASLTAQELVLDTAQGPARFALGTLAVVTRKQPPTVADSGAVVWIELVDNSGIAAKEYTTSGRTANISSAAGAQLEVATDRIRSVRFGSAAGRDPKLNKQWSEITESKASGDLLVVRKNGALDYLEGVLKGIDPQTCHFEWDKEPFPVNRAKVEGVVYFHATPPELPEAVGQLFAADGSRLALRTVELADGTLKVNTPAGVSLNLPLDAATRIDFSSGKVAYLSDLEPETASYVPYFGFAETPAAVEDFYQLRRDGGLGKSPLRLDGKAYRKGLALPSRTVLTYKLPGKFRLFRATVGIDDSVRETGDAHVEISGDGKQLWQAEVRGSEPARELELEIAGVKRLEITVDYGAGLDIGDQVDLCEARVTK